jgi:formylglycine-generating enzyme required for sulfatase activity
MYKWRDSNGVLHFSDEPPAELQKSNVKVEASDLSESEGGVVTNRFGMEFRYIPPGTFTMGNFYVTSCFSAVFSNPRQVTLTKGFYIQTTEVTQRQWASVVNTNPSHFKSCGGDCPVEMVSWKDIKEFIEKLNRMDNGRRYRLPTEAEWEYATRAGSESKFCFGNDKKQLRDYGWYYDNSNNRTHPVARKKPNSWGLYDMHGNVFEYCLDGYYPYTSMKPVTDPKTNVNLTRHVLRSGSFLHCPPYAIQVAGCMTATPTTGKKPLDFGWFSRWPNNRCHE